MNTRLNELGKNADAADSEIINDELDMIAEQCEISDDLQARILSSTMRKAGFEMKTITMNKTKWNDRLEAAVRTETAHLRRGGALAACLALALTGTAAAVLLFGGRAGLGLGSRLSSASQMESTVSEVAVPNVVNKMYDEAADILTDEGLVPKEEQIYDHSPAGTVVKTEPAHDAKVKSGSEVTLYVSRGKLDEQTREQLIETANELYEELKVYHGSTIKKFNNDYGTSLKMIKPDESMTKAMLLRICSEFEACMKMSEDEFYDHIEKTYLENASENADAGDLFVNE